MSRVEASDLIKVFRSGDIEVTALRGVDLTVEENQFVLILGPSGSGKTTLLNLIGGLDRPTAGQVQVDGARVDRMSERELARYRRTEVGFVFQFFNLIPSLTAFQNVEFPMALRHAPREERRAQARELLRSVGLERRLDHYPHQLSGGEQQRVAVAVALANDPPLILADEPTGELDSQAGQNILELLRALRDKRKKTVITVSHDPRAERFADRIFRMEDGKVIPLDR